jgi:hypothetical protein
MLLFDRRALLERINGTVINAGREGIFYYFDVLYYLDVFWFQSWFLR